MRHAAIPFQSIVRGYTLIELVISTASLAILLQLAIPEMTGLPAAWQRDSATRAITDHLALARSGAICWSRRVVMCSSPDGRSCAPGATKDWRSGWIVFQDLDVNGQLDASDKLIAVSQGPHGVRDMRGNALIRRFVFMPTGMMASGMDTLAIAPKAGRSQRITVNRIGRIRLSMGEPTGAT